MGIIVLVFSTITGPFQEFFYYRSLTKNTFLTHGKDNKEWNVCSKDLKIEDTADLVNNLKKRQPFYFKSCEAFMSTKIMILLCKCCCKKTFFLKKQRQMFDYSKDKLDKMMDISVIQKHLKVLKMMSYVYFTDSQRALIPYFNKKMIDK